MSAPALDHASGSWVVVDRLTGRAVLETYRRSVADKVNRERYDVLTAREYLATLNRTAP